jgi:hypothetical protein
LRDLITFHLENAPKPVEGVGYIPTHLYTGAVVRAYEGKPQRYLTIREVLQKEQTF